LVYNKRAALWDSYAKGVVYGVWQGMKREVAVPLAGGNREFSQTSPR